MKTDKKKRTHCIYLLTSPSGRNYGGQTIRGFKARWREHYLAAYNRDAPDYEYPLSRAIRKYGKESFKHTILHGSILTQTSANKLEILGIRNHKCHVSDGGYNLARGGESCSGYEWTTKQKAEHSILAKQIQNKPKRRKQLKLSAIKQQAAAHNMTLKEWKTANELETRICACGCNTTFKCKRRSNRKYIHGGHCKSFEGCLHTSKSKQLISKNNKMQVPAIKIVQVASQMNLSELDYKLSIKLESRVCACGCNKKFKCKKRSNKKYISGHNGIGLNNGRYVSRITKSCSCGCGKTFECLANSSKKFIHGHNQNSKSSTQVSKALKKAWITRRKNKQQIIIDERRSCACGCKQIFECKSNSLKQFISGHNVSNKGSDHSSWISIETRICACGCNRTFNCKINSLKKFIHPHQNRLKHNQFLIKL